MAKYYHVIRKQGVWHLYAGNSLAALAMNTEQRAVVKAARALARHDGGHVVVHKDHSTDVYGAGEGAATQTLVRGTTSENLRPA